MILRKFPIQRILILSLHLLTIVTSSENDKTYDDSDWVPINPSNPPDNTKKAEGRVLNLEAPSQNYFPENEYVAKRPQPQYVQQVPLQKEPNTRQHKTEPYKFEPVVPLQPPQYVPQNQFVQQVPQFIQPIPYIQTLQQVQQVPRVPEPTLNQQLVAPPQSTQNYYDTNKGQLPANISFVQTSNLGTLNQELIGAIQHQNINQNVDNIQITTTTVKPKEEKESIQLLYVPFENLQSNQPVTQTPRTVKQTEAPRREKQISIVQKHKLNQLSNIEDDFIRQALAAHKLHQQFKSGEPLVLETTTTTTTPRPKKRKPNQPPLSVYMAKQGAADVKDVLEVLKQAKSISVQDSAGPDSPKVFVGPSNIEPEGYAKFPLPYLSSVQGNRIERKVQQLPFFVAPLSYKTPDGYSKIPLPSPHVGSVVVQTKEHLHEKHPEVIQPQTAQNQIVQDFDLKQPFAHLGKPNPYLLNQRTQAAIDEFLGNFPINNQNYEVSSSKGFTDGDDYQLNPNYSQNYDEIPSRDLVQNYQQGLRDNPDYYETTPSYRPTEKTRNYQIPDYQTTERQLTNQNPKELVRDYDIPSLQVESKTNFAPNYQLEEKPQIDQFGNLGGSVYTTPANVYNLNEGSTRSTTTTTEASRPIPQSQFKLVQSTEPKFKDYSSKSAVRDPYGQVIDQFEIEQINSQFGEEKTEKIEAIRSTTPAAVSTTRRHQNYDAPTSRGRSRSRFRSRTTTTTTTPSTIEENYTILEEFNIQPKSTTEKYTTEVETIPAKVYKLEPQPPESTYVEKSTPLKQQSLNQGILDEQILHRRPVASIEQEVLQQKVPSRLTGDYNQQILQTNAPFRQSVNFNPQILQTDAPSRPSVDFNLQFPQNIPSRVTPQTEAPLAEIQNPRGQSLRTRISPESTLSLTNIQDSRLPPVRSRVTPEPEISLSDIQDSRSPPVRSRVTPEPEISLSDIQDPRLPPVRSRVTTEPDISLSYIQDSRLPPVRSRVTPETEPPVTDSQDPRLPPSRSRVTPEPEPTLADIPDPRLITLSRVPSEPEGPVSNIQDPRLTPLVHSRGQNQHAQEQIPEINPYLPGLVNNLQDQAVRHLLVPNLLVPTTEKLSTVPPPPSTEEIRIVTTTEAPKIETTTQRRSRGRQRANTSRYSSTSAPRRTSNRRRPSYTRPTTERQYVRTTTEAVDYEPTRRATQRQRFRTRGRPVQREQAATERVLQTTENVFKQPQLEGGFQASPGDPESYMQFDHVVDNQQVITIKPQQAVEETPMREYHQLYNLPQSPSTERVFNEITTTSKPVVDVKITHPVTERIQEHVIVTTPRDDTRYIKIKSGGALYNNEDLKPRVSGRQRVRSRNRNRFSSTTPRVITTTTTTTPKPEEAEEEEEEFYGFIRKPIFNKPEPVVIQTTTSQPLPVYSSTYQQTPRTLIQLEEDAIGSGQTHTYESVASPAPVQFVGQIRPKYTTTEAQEYSTEAPKVRSRPRIRVPNRKTPNQSYNEVKTQRLDEQVTRRSSVVRSRTRGKSHFKAPENLQRKKENLQGQNYPASYLKTRELTTEKPSAFQITVDPADEELEEDQVPHSSLYSPQIIRNTDAKWVEASILPANELEIEDKAFVSSEEQTTLPIEEAETVVAQTEKIEEEEVPTTTEIIETTTKKRRKVGRRRGVWKLVKHRPIDSFETAESQNYFSVLNAFENVEKTNKDKDHTIETTSSTTTTTTTAPKTRSPITTTTTESSIFEALYSMLGFASKASQVPQTKTKVKVYKAPEITHKEEITTTTASPTFPEEITEEVTTQELKQTEESQTEETTTLFPQTTTTEATIKNYDVEPWETHEVKTSTSTEISHETEICFKGRCVKSKDDETRL